MKTTLFSLLLCCFLFSACQRSGHLSTFEINPLPAHVKQFAWVKLADDQAQDGRRKDSADGKALHYFYDAETDTLWFKLELYNAVSKRPAVSISIDTDADQTTGIGWYGANSAFQFEKMLSVGPISQDGEVYTGYNGITNQEGVAAADWINEKQNVLAFHVDPADKAYFIGVKRADLMPERARIHVIGSVGANALWNDDIGETGYAEIDLSLDG